MANITLSMTSTPFTGSKAFTGSDADMQSLLDWGRVKYKASLPANPSNGQIGAAIANGIIANLKDEVRVFMTTPGVPAPMTWA